MALVELGDSIEGGALVAFGEVGVLSGAEGGGGVGVELALGEAGVVRGLALGRLGKQVGRVLIQYERSVRTHL